jgi:transcriptional regulator with XRE-family HTH domain
MHEDADAAEDDFSQAFGQNMRSARSQKGWSQRELAEALDTRGVRLDPSAVTRIERGAREVKLREAVEIADCLSIDLQQLLRPAGPDPLSMVLELRRFAEKRMRSGRFAFAELGHYARAMQEILEVRPEARDRLRRLRGRSETVDSHELVVGELEDLLRDLQWADPDFEVEDVDEQLGGVLQRVVNAAVQDLFTGEDSGRAARRKRRSAGKGDAEA